MTFLVRNLLIVENNLLNVDIITQALNQDEVVFTFQIVQSKEEYEKLISNTVFDLILCNSDLPFFDPVQAFKMNQKKTLAAPFIYFSDKLNFEQAVCFIKNGVSHYFELNNSTTISQRIKCAFFDSAENNEHVALKPVVAVEQPELYDFSALDVLKSNIAIINFDGIIIKVNKSWIEFGKENNASEITCNEGASYFAACENSIPQKMDFGVKALKGIREVISNIIDEFELEYPCNSQTKRMWFKMRVKKIDNYPRLLLIEHTNISEYKVSQKQLTDTTNVLVETITTHNKILDQSLDLVCSFNEDGQIIHVNYSSLTTLGYNPAELIGRNFFDFIIVEDIDKTKISFSEIKSGVPVALFENRVYHQNGDVLHFFWSIRWDLKTKICYCIGRDETDKKRLEKTVNLERRRFMDLYLQSPFCTGILKGPEHIFETANPLYMKLIGKNDIIGRTVREVLPELGNQGIFELLDYVYRTGITFTANEMLVKFDYKKDNQLSDVYLNFLYQAHTDSTGNIDGILFFAIDVTEQVVARKVIEKSEKKFRQIVETAQEGIWMIDENNITTFVNSKMAKILEYSPEEMLGKDIFFFMQEKDKAKVLKLMKVKRENFTGLNFKFTSKSGQAVWTTISANPLFNDDGTFKGALAMVIDATERKKNLVKLENQNFDLIKANLELDKFVYSVSHDLRSPLTSVLGLLSFIEEETQEPDTLEHAKMIRNSINRLDEFIKNILSYSRNNRVSVNTNEISIEHTITTIVNELKNSPEAKEIDFKLEFNNSTTFFSDQIRLNTVLENLISNAIKHHRKDASYKFIHIRTNFNNKKLYIDIADNGIGIDEKYHEKIFEMFYRVSGISDGSGIGLYIVKNTLKNINGNIEIESSVGMGTTFKITIKL